MVLKTDPEQKQQPVVGRYRVETWGCQMNTHDSEKLAGLLVKIRGNISIEQIAE